MCATSKGELWQLLMTVMFTFVLLVFGAMDRVRFLIFICVHSVWGFSGNSPRKAVVQPGWHLQKV